MKAHNALIHWSAEHETRGLPAFLSTADPAQLIDQEPAAGEAWSLVCEFGEPPVAQGNPSKATVHFWVTEAPHDALVPGARLSMFERATRKFALVEIID